MEEERHLNVKKVVITVLILIAAFSIIIGSALLTRKSGSKKTKKNLEITDPNISKVTQSILNKEDNNEKIEDNQLTQKEDEITENMGMLGNIANEIQNQISSNSENTKPAVSSVSDGRVPVSNPDAISLCKQAQTSKEKNIYLTFDDGPSPNVTPQILATLKRYNVPATFFVLGSRVELYPDLVKQEYNEGHYIANHGYSHQYSSIYSSVQSVIDEYDKCDLAVQTALGNSNYHTLLFRFPGGSSGGPYNNLKQTAKSTLESMGIASTNWNCLNGDAEATGRTKQQLINRLYETAAEWDSLVVLMHDADDKQTTADALPEIIEHYQAEGYTFKNYYDIFK